jgi:hypothetical protein
MSERSRSAGSPTRFEVLSYSAQAALDAASKRSASQVVPLAITRSDPFARLGKAVADRVAEE